MSERTRGAGRGAQAGRRGVLTLAFCLFALASLAAAGCAVEGRRSGLPRGAQTLIDTLTDDIASGRFDKIYAESADEWRASVTEEESRRVLSRVRDTFGRAQSRVPVRASEQGAEGAETHAVSATYNTKFERGDAIESLTLVEREGRWQLARYALNSDALR
jgi:hypothetical protein